MKTYPLLQSQMGVFLEWLANPEMTQYNLPFMFPISASIDSSRMVQAIEKLVEARPEMKMRFVMEEGEVRQYMDEGIRICMNVKQMPEAEVQAYAATFIRPYDLLSGEPLWRFELIETEEQKYFCMDCHHIMADGTSINHTFFPELATLYNGGQLAPHEKTILDYAEAENASFDSEDYQKAKTFQAAKFGEASLLALAQEGGDVWGRQLRSSAYLPMEQLDAWCKSIGTKSNRLIMAAFSYVMSVLSREDKVAFATVRNGRTDEQMKQAYGMFVKTMPVLADVNRHQKVVDFIKGFRDELVSAIQNDVYPFTHFCRDLGQKPGVMFAFQGGDIQEVLHLDGTDYFFRVMQQELTAADLSVLVFMVEDRYEIRVEASEKLHSAAYLQMVADAVRTATLNMMTCAEDELGSISIVSEEQEAALMQLAQGGELEFDRSETLVDFFRKQVARTPDSIAIVYKDRRLTYREVDELTDRLAVKLHTLGVGPEQAVGVMVDRSELMFVYPMAIMKAGAAYMPLDSHFPEDRLAFMCQDAGIRLILSDDGLVQQVMPGFDGMLFQQSELAALLAVSSEDVAALPKATPQNMFVILYTSGSTGKPKGCMLEHHNIVNFCHWYIANFSMTAEDRVVAYANFGFDAHMIDLYPALSVGACVHILAPDVRMDLVAMSRYIEDNRINVAFMTTQIGYLFATSMENHTLRLLSVGGEKLPPIQKPPFRFCNLYGPTECTILCSFYEIVNDYYDSSYIGRPMPGFRLYVVDKNMQLVPQGVPGELVVTGEGVGRGYLNRPEMNAEKFITFRGVKAYRTGDLVRWSPDGNIDFMGRIDNQVKLRGLRIELGEIEARASQLDGIRTVCVDVKETAGNQNLVCYYCEKEGMTVEPSVLKAWLAETLSDFMVPEIYMKLDALPLTSNGKVNRKALPLPQLAASMEYVEPANETERLFCGIFAQILKMERVGATDNFFALGGSSLAVMRIIVETDKAGHKLVYKDVFTHPTPRELAQFVSDGEAGAENDFSEITDYDYQKLEEVLQVNTVDSFRQGERQDLGNVLLTGATGYLGIHILKELLESDGGHIYCLVRGNKNQTAESRLKTLLFYYFDSTFDEAFDGRITVVDGDITQPEIFTALEKESIHTVINCAAVVKHFSQGTDIEDVNVGGVRNIIRYCLQTDARLVHVSTVSVAGMSVDGKPAPWIRISEQMLYFGQSVDNKYIYSKFLAERYILEAVSENGLNAKIMRVGNLAARNADGEFQINFHTNSFMGRLKVFRMLGVCAYGDLDGLVEFSPIDETAHAILLLATTPRACTVFHPYNPHTELVSDIFAEMKKLDMPVEAVEPECFCEALEQAKADPVKAQTLSCLLAYATTGSQTILVGADNQYTLQVLHRLGYSWPYTSWDYISRSLLALKGLGFFEV